MTTSQESSRKFSLEMKSEVHYKRLQNLTENQNNT